MRFALAVEHHGLRRWRPRLNRKALLRESDDLLEVLEQDPKADVPRKVRQRLHVLAEVVVFEPILPSRCVIAHGWLLDLQAKLLRTPEGDLELEKKNGGWGRRVAERVVSAAERRMVEAKAASEHRPRLGGRAIPRRRLR